MAASFQRTSLIPYSRPDRCAPAMLAKKTSKNQLTLPKGGRGQLSRRELLRRARRGWAHRARAAAG